MVAIDGNGPHGSEWPWHRVDNHRGLRATWMPEELGKTIRIALLQENLLRQEGQLLDRVVVRRKAGTQQASGDRRRIDPHPVAGSVMGGQRIFDVESGTAARRLNSVYQFTFMGVPKTLPQVILQHGEGAEVGIEVIERNNELSLEECPSPLDLPRCGSRLIVEKGVGLPGIPLLCHAQSSPIEREVIESMHHRRWETVQCGQPIRPVTYRSVSVSRGCSKICSVSPCSTNRPS